MLGYDPEWDLEVFRPRPTCSPPVDKLAETHTPFCSSSLQPAFPAFPLLCGAPNPLLGCHLAARRGLFSTHQCCHVFVSVPRACRTCHAGIEQQPGAHGLPSPLPRSGSGDMQCSKHAARWGLDSELAVAEARLPSLVVPNSRHHRRFRREFGFHMQPTGFDATVSALHLHAWPRAQAGEGRPSLCSTLNSGTRRTGETTA